MKTIIAILALFCCYACTNDSPKEIFDQTPQQRTDKIKDEYRKVLLNAPHGWKTYFGTSNSVGYWLVLMKFDEKGNVEFKCDPVDYYYEKGVTFDDTLTYRLDYLQHPELIIESFSQFSAWNEFVVDTNNDGYVDAYAGPETQFIFDGHRDGKLYMKGKSNMGIGKNKSEVRTYVFEPATEQDWKLEGISQVKKAINFNSQKGKYQRLLYKGKFLESLFFVDAENRVVLYRYNEGLQSHFSILPFYITSTGFSLVDPLTIKGVGVVQHFVVNEQNENPISSTHPELSIAYTDKGAAVLRMAFDTFDKVYLAIDVYHSTGDPIGRNLKTFFDELRPPHAPEEQHLNVIYFAKNIDKDMGKIAFKYPQELTLIYADTDPSYAGKDLYGNNATFVRIPVEYQTTDDRRWIISLSGSIEQAFIDAYKEKGQDYARSKAKAAMPMLYRLLNESGWGMYAQGTTTNNPTVKVMDEEDPAGSFFTLYPYTQTDVDR